MSKKKDFSDPRQKKLDFYSKIEAYQGLKEEILDDLSKKKPLKQIENYAEACIEIAAGIKRALKTSGLSREQVVDGINDYFGDTKKHLSIHIFNHFLSKPAEYPVPAAYLFAIQHITNSLEPIRTFAETLDAQVISGAEVRELALGKLDEYITQMQKLKRELKLKG